MLRKILAIVIAYVVFAASAGAWFQLTGQKPHYDATLTFKLETLAYGVLFSLIAGFLVRLISRSPVLTLNYILAALMFSLAAISLILSGGSHWTQWMTMFIFAPCSMLGGKIQK